MKRLAHDARGSVYVETFIAFLPVFVFFLATLQLADASVAQLVVDHASAAAARAAVVVLPDDGQFYEDRDQAYLDKFDKLRRDDVELAADLILRANPRLEAAAPNVNLTGSFSDRYDVVATVTARYGCLLPGLCGGGWFMKGTAALVYQGAKFTYDDTTIGKFKRKRDHATEGKPVDEDPPKDNGGKADDGEGGKDKGEQGDKPRDERKPREEAKPRGEGPPKAKPEPAKPTEPKPGDAKPGQTKPATPDGRPTLPIVGVTDDQGHLVDYKTCFVAGTKITTPEDARAIETIAPGDAVFAYDEASKEVVMAQVVRTFTRKIDEIFDLTIRVPGGAQNTITGTGTHPFYVQGRGYVQLKALTIGNKLLTFDGSHAEVIALASRKGTFDVFNFEVQDQHNYFVQGANEPGNAVLVHNICPPISNKEEKKARERFRREMLNQIKADPNHPLRFLLETDAKGKLRFKQPPKNASRGELLGGENDPAPWYVQAGHGTSKHSGDDQYLGLQDAWDNQYQGAYQEGYWVPGDPKDWKLPVTDPDALPIVSRVFVEIGGVPVEKYTAQQWVQLGLLDPEVLKNAPVTAGWDVQKFVQDRRDKSKP